jgi:hypothetical protein
MLNPIGATDSGSKPLLAVAHRAGLKRVFRKLWVSCNP